MSERSRKVCGLSGIAFSYRQGRKLDFRDCMEKPRGKRCFFLHTAAFFVDKAPACYYNSVVKMAFLCGFVAARKKYS